MRVGLVNSAHLVCLDRSQHTGSASVRRRLPPPQPWASHATACRRHRRTGGGGTSPPDLRRSHICAGTRPHLRRDSRRESCQLRTAARLRCQLRTMQPIGSRSRVPADRRQWWCSRLSSAARSRSRRCRWPSCSWMRRRGSSPPSRCSSKRRRNAPRHPAHPEGASLHGDSPSACDARLPPCRHADRGTAQRTGGWPKPSKPAHVQLTWRRESGSRTVQSRRRCAPATRHCSCTGACYRGSQVQCAGSRA